MPQNALHELLARLGGNKGAAVFLSEEELSHWPATAVEAMKTQKLLARAQPASSAVCPGCEQECVMLVHTLTDVKMESPPFIVCDKRNDINRVAVSVSMLERWQATGASIAEMLAGLLALRRPDSDGMTSGRWEVGLLKGAKHSSHLVLKTDGGLVLTLAGHTIALADILAIEDNGFKLDKRMLVRLDDKPAGSAGDAESATQRRARLKQRAQGQKDKGNKAFLKTVAEEEGISVSRPKQILQAKPTPRKKIGRST